MTKLPRLLLIKRGRTRKNVTVSHSLADLPPPQSYNYKSLRDNSTQPREPVAHIYHALR